jgi:5-methylcytosine-specific restriction endonuclease McrA
MDNKTKNYIISALRRINRWDKTRALALKRARHCGICKKLFLKQKDKKADHVLPVRPISGWDSWDGVVERLFCEIDGYQALCEACHRLKTNNENKMRRLIKASRPVVDKK